MIRSTVAHVNLNALKSNFRAIDAYLSTEPGPSTSLGTGRTAPGIIAVIKANAYGHGSPRVACALEEAGATMLACADIEEGIVIRQAGVRLPILVFGALSVSDLDGLFEYSLTPTISTPGAARAVQAAAARHKTTIAYHLKIDTGMNRLGFRHDNLRRTLPELFRSPNLRLDAVYTHFASADVPESPAFGDQRERFEAVWAVVRELATGGSEGQPLQGRVRSIKRHAANSAATLRDSRVWYDAVRPGLLLYGIVPPPLASTIPLEPVMSLTSRVVAVKGLRPGEGVGYGWRYQTTEPRTVAVVPAGYADGLDTRLGGRGHVLIRGGRAPIIGAVSMDMITVDVTDHGDVQPGDEVVLLGRQGDESWQRIDAREVAAAIGTIPWEIVCRLGTRVERQYE
ncbi:MAG TPA: alanine racemase [Vicinamibacterales bacterium]|nr:alanine racemase [Vicinamibacterales bacterium]